MEPDKDDNIIDLIVPEDDLLTFNLPSSMDAVRSAYSNSYEHKQKEKKLIENPIKHIERLFPKNKESKKNQYKEKKIDNKDDPGFSIDQDEEPLII